MVREALAETISCERRVPAAPADVFDAFSQAGVARDWLCDEAELDARPGGRLFLWWHSGAFAAGVFSDVLDGQRLVFSWQGAGDPAATEVRVSFEADADATVVHIVHGGLGTGERWIEAGAALRRGWDEALENLAGLLETGYDQRLARRPMVGITNPTDLTSERAAALGVPAGGVWVDGVVDGFGAQRAGLRHDDVIVKLDGRLIVTGADLGAALSARRAGDSVALEYYRDGALESGQLELTVRPLPALRATAAEHAEAARAAYAAVDAELRAALDGVSDAEAAAYAAPGEWNMLEEVAHLVAVERDLQHWLAALYDGEEGQPAFHANDTTRLRALVAANPTLAGLLEELRRSQHETVELLAALPPRLSGRKYLMVRIGAWITDPANQPVHIRDHIASLAQKRNGAGSN